MGLWRTMLRVLVGWLFVGHGTQKLFGWFGGEGLEATAQGFEKLGLTPSRENAVAAGVAEAGGGALLAAGLETPFAAAALIASMLTAIRRVHGKNGPWVTKGGYEYNAVLIATLVALVESGPGRLSIDRALGRSRSGPAWAGMALLAGALGAYAVEARAQHGLPGLPAVAWLERRMPHEVGQSVAA